MSGQSRSLAILSTIIALGILASAVHAVDPQATFNFEGALHGFGGGSQSYTNPPNGGVGNSGYLLVSNALSGRLGARSLDPDLTGDYVAANIQAVRVSLNDVSGGLALEVHLVLGVANLNVWQSNLGVSPPPGSWQEFVFDMTDSSQWTQVQGTGTFADALAITNRFLLRHDLAPFTQAPNLIVADLGIDQIAFDVLPTAVVETVPAATALLGNIPNPFNAMTTIAFNLSEPATVRLHIYDVAGHHIRLLRDERFDSGAHRAIWNGLDDTGSPVASGVYFYALQAGNYRADRRMVLLK